MLRKIKEREEKEGNRRGNGKEREKSERWEQKTKGKRKKRKLAAPAISSPMMAGQRAMDTVRELWKLLRG